MPTIEEEPVDPQPAVLVSQEELEDIRQRAHEFARKRHVAGAPPVGPNHVVGNFQMPPL